MVRLSEENDDDPPMSSGGHDFLFRAASRGPAAPLLGGPREERESQESPLYNNG